MPFTFAHPAIILPFNYCSKRYFSLTGLVTGSLAPDFEYFLRMRTKGVYGHTLSGIFWFDLPLAILLAFIFHNIVRNQLIIHLPSFLIVRLQRYTTFDWNKRFTRSWFVIILSTLIGISSHLFWDSFTHEHGFFVEHLKLLRSAVGPVAVYNILQHASTLVGFIIIAWSIMQLQPESIHKKGKKMFAFWSGIFTIASTITILKILLIKDEGAIGNLVATVIASFLLALIVMTYYFKKKNFPIGIKQ
jgi:hypothetical protein